jgi:DNA mismatch repair protein MutL
LQQDTEYVNINGFIGTPQATSKTRGNQFFFVNNRFIKSAYLNHAVNNAYQSLIAKDEFPAFVLFLDINPEKVDANVHPTKQEIKFEDEKIIYAFVNSAVKHALSKNSIAPSIDFELDAGISQLSSITQPFTNFQRSATQKDFLFNSFTQAGSAHLINKKDDVKNWKELYKIGENDAIAPSMEMPYRAPMHNSSQISTGLDSYDDNHVQFLFQKYILYPKSSGFLLIDAVAALERIAYDQYAINNSDGNSSSIQKLLHPQTIELSATDALLLSEILLDLERLGFEVEHFGAQTFIIQGVPADVNIGDAVTAIEQILEQIKHASADVKLDKREKLLRTMAWQKANRTSLISNVDMLKEICTKLFTSTQPTFTPRGKKIIIDISASEIEKRFLNAE